MGTLFLGQSRALAWLFRHCVWNGPTSRSRDCVLASQIFAYGGQGVLEKELHKYTCIYVMLGHVCVARTRPMLKWFA